MASSFKEGATYYARYKAADGRWRQRATKAQTKTEARKIAIEIEQREDRLRLGLTVPMPKNGGGTVGELLQRWLTETSRAAAARRNDGTVRKHILTAPIARLQLAHLRPHDVENFLDEREGIGLGPQSINHLRSFLSRAFSTAKRKGWWQGPNPIADVRKRKVPRRLVQLFLRPHEVPAVLAALHPRHRPLFATALFTGLRRGELAGLRKQDVDLDRRLITVQRSYARDTTKGGHADAVPLGEQVLPFLREALRTSRHPELVFPGPGGDMFHPHYPLEGVLRRALARAGIIEGYTQVCRRKGCGHSESAPDAGLRLCPQCRMKLWPKARVRPIRFHDLRHSTGSLLTMAGAGPVAVQRILRHRSIQTTIGTYTHLSDGWLHGEMDRLRFELPDYLGGLGRLAGDALVAEPRLFAAGAPELPASVPANGSGRDGRDGRPPPKGRGTHRSKPVESGEVVTQTRPMDVAGTPGAPTVTPEVTGSSPVLLAVLGIRMGIHPLDATRGANASPGCRLIALPRRR